MPYSSELLLNLALLLFLLPINELRAQESPNPHPPDYPGVKTYIPGVFITPVPGAPFSGTVEILSKQSMPDGSVYTRRTINHIARNSSGVIHNERRKLVPPDFQEEPRILPHTSTIPKRASALSWIRRRTSRGRSSFGRHRQRPRIAHPIRRSRPRTRRI